MADTSKSLRTLTLRQLRTLRAVARHGNLSLAARELHLTQPAVSMQLKELETSCGLPLYDRAGRGIALTEAGRALDAAASTVLDALRTTEEQLDAMRGLRAGHLRLAVVSTAKYFAPSMLAAFTAVHPGVTVQLAVGNREDIVARLAANECDLAIMGRPPRETPTAGHAFADHPLGIVAEPRHALARRRRLALADLAGEHFLVREPGSGTRAAMEALFAGAGFVYRTAMEVASNETIKQAVMAGMGVSFISLHTVSVELASGRLVMLNVKGLPVRREWYALHRDHKRLSPVAQSFMAFLLAHGASLLPDLPAVRRRAPRHAGATR